MTGTDKDLIAIRDLIQDYRRIAQGVNARERDLRFASAQKAADALARIKNDLKRLTEDEGDGREPDGHRLEGGRVIPTDR